MTTTYTDMSDEELGQVFRSVVDEQERRRVLQEAKESIIDLNRRYLDAAGVQPGQPWRQPTGAHDAYPLDWEAPHQGKRWRSTQPNNMQEPGVAGWQEVEEAAP